MAMIKLIKDGELGPPPVRTLEWIEGPPEDGERNVAKTAASRRTSAYLESEWPHLLPQAKGKWVAVAEEQLFVADTAAEAMAWVKANHPDALGWFVYDFPPHDEV